MSSKQLAIVDYGGGNIRNVIRAVAAVGYPAVATPDRATIEAAAGIILPGVGASGDLMRSLDRLGLVDTLRELIARGVPFLGICVGLQILLDGSEEFGWQRCLGIVAGRVRRLPAGLKVPHIGWNQVVFQAAHPVIDGIPDRSNFYFVHSYFVEPTDPALVAGTTDYDGFTFCSAIARRNLFAVQFHPEKSGAIGLEIYRNFCRFALDR